MDFDERPDSRKNEDLVHLKDEDPAVTCCFCGRHELKDLEWGGLFKLNSVVLHYFCLLFSSGIDQKGEDHEGVFGFLEEDILKEVRRGVRLKCKWCRGNTATVGCTGKSCKASFHYPCGYENGGLSQFNDPFPSFCNNHRPRRNVPKRGIDRTCPICLMMVDDLSEAISLPCCGKCLFHRKCMMHTAKEAGYFFKCPLCNDVEKFVNDMKNNGIFVPDQDAGWETPEAFRDQYQLYSTCDAKKCLCPKGRNFNEKLGRKWRIVRCNGCGSSATHTFCGDLDSDLNWKCGVCSRVLRDNDNGLRGISDFLTSPDDYELIEIEDDTPDPQPSTSAQACTRQASRRAANAELVAAREDLCDMQVFYKQHPSNRTIASLRERRGNDSLTSGLPQPDREHSSLKSRLDALMKAAREIEVINVEDD